MRAWVGNVKPLSRNEFKTGYFAAARVQSFIRPNSDSLLLQIQRPVLTSSSTVIIRLPCDNIGTGNTLAIRHTAERVQIR